MKQISLILDKIQNQNPMHGKRVQKFLESVSHEQKAEIEEYVEQYILLSTHLGISMEEVVNSYLEMVEGILEEQFFFARENRYRYQSLMEVENHVYHHERNMKAYMLGLALSQFLWENHYGMFSFLKEEFERGQKKERYLEIGVGHGLFLKEAIRSDKFEHHTAVDISRTSLELSRSFMGVSESKVRWIHQDILDYQEETSFDFITMGEVLEHVERPEELLVKVRNLLKKDGRAYLSTCANAPVVDHIYLFRNVEEIRQMFLEAGLTIEREFVISVDHIPPEKWEKKKANITYAAIVGREI